MRGSKAKALRKAAKLESQGFPAQGKLAYYDTVEKTEMIKDGNGNITYVDKITTRVEPQTQRAVYKLMKKISKESKTIIVTK